MTYDFLMLNPASDTPLYQQLYESLRRSIERGHLTTNEKLPSIRKLSEDLRLSRTTVEMAYQQLCVEGYVRASAEWLFRRGRGHPAGALQPFGASPDDRASGTSRPQHPLQFRQRFGGQRVHRHQNLAPPYPRRPHPAGGAHLLWRSPGGTRPAGSALLLLLRRPRCKASPEQIVVGAGTQPLLYLLCGLLPEKTVAIDERGFRRRSAFLRTAALRFCACPPTGTASGWTRWR